MYRPALTDAEWRSYIKACQSSKRVVRFWMRLYNKNGAALGLDSRHPNAEFQFLGGEVVVDATNAAASPVTTAHVSLYDRTGKLSPNNQHSVDGAHWFAKGIGLWAGLWVEDIGSAGEWVDVPVFRGRVSEVTHRGGEIEIDAQGLEAGHIPPHSFPKAPPTKHKHMRIGAVIKDILRTRGEAKFSFPIDKHTRRLKHPLNYKIGDSPWEKCLKLADALVNTSQESGRNRGGKVDYQLYVRGDGTFRLRRWPTTPCWIFNSKETSTAKYPQTAVLGEVDERVGIDKTRNVFVVMTDKVFRRATKVTRKLASKAVAADTTIEVTSNADFIVDRKVTIGTGNYTRTISGVSGNTITLKRAIGRAFAKGTPVTVWVSATDKVHAVGRAGLKDKHPLSSQSLSAGKRPLVSVSGKTHKAEGAKKFSNRAHDVHAFRKDAQHKAEARARNARMGVEHEFSFSAQPVYHLEAGDKVRVEAFNGYKTIRLKQFTLPLEVDGTMEVGWGSKDVPRQRARGRGR